MEPKSAIRAVWLQAIASLITIVVAATSLWFAREALLSQQEINRSQIAINETQQAEERGRFASAVIYWNERQGGCGMLPGDKTACVVTVHIDNHSPVTLDRLVSTETFLDYASSVVYFNYIPPCSSITFKRTDTRELSMLVFSDPSGLWLRGSDGHLRETSGNPYFVDGLAGDRPYLKFGEKKINVEMLDPAQVTLTRFPDCAGF